MTNIITWKCSSCANEDSYPAFEGVTMDSLQNEDVTTNTMCRECGAPCNLISVEPGEKP